MIMIMIDDLCDDLPPQVLGGGDDVGAGGVVHWVEHLALGADLRHRERLQECFK